MSWIIGLHYATQLSGSQQVDFGSLRTKIVTVAPQSRRIYATDEGIPSPAAMKRSGINPSPAISAQKVRKLKLKK